DTEGRARICGAPATTTRAVRGVDFTTCDTCAANVDKHGPNVEARRLAPAAEPRRCTAALVVDGVSRLCGEPATVECPIPTREGFPPLTSPFCAKHAPPHVEIDDEENDEEQAMGRKLRRAAKRGDL